MKILNFSVENALVWSVLFSQLSQPEMENFQPQSAGIKVEFNLL